MSCDIKHDNHDRNDECRSMKYDGQNMKHDNQSMNEDKRSMYEDNHW